MHFNISIKSLARQTLWKNKEPIAGIRDPATAVLATFQKGSRALRKVYIKLEIITTQTLCIIIYNIIVSRVMY